MCSSNSKVAYSFDVITAHAHSYQWEIMFILCLCHFVKLRRIVVRHTCHFGRAIGRTFLKANSRVLRTKKNRFCKIIDEFKFRIHILHKTTKRKFLSRTLQLNNKYMNLNYWNCAKKKQIAKEIISYSVERSTGIAEIRDRIPLRLNFCRLSSLNCISCV